MLLPVRCSVPPFDIYLCVIPSTHFIHLFIRFIPSYSSVSFTANRQPINPSAHQPIERRLTTNQSLSLYLSCLTHTLPPRSLSLYHPSNTVESIRVIYTQLHSTPHTTLHSSLSSIPLSRLHLSTNIHTLCRQVQYVFTPQSFSHSVIQSFIHTCRLSVTFSYSFLALSLPLFLSSNSIPSRGRFCCAFSLVLRFWVFLFLLSVIDFTRFFCFCFGFCSLRVVRSVCPLSVLFSVCSVRL